jgi:hypothetical protein
MGGWKGLAAILDIEGLKINPGLTRHPDGHVLCRHGWDLSCPSIAEVAQHMVGLPLTGRSTGSFVDRICRISMTKALSPAMEQGVVLPWFPPRKSNGMSKTGELFPRHREDYLA